MARMKGTRASKRMKMTEDVKKKEEIEKTEKIEKTPKKMIHLCFFDTCCAGNHSKRNFFQNIGIY
jgi:hypothetical protein